MELKNNGKINFILDLFINFKDQMSGGLVALHKLAYEIANRGHNVYIFCEPEYPHENIHVIKSTTEIEGSRFHSTWERFSYNLNNTVSLYTEHNLNNPFNTSHITRWILYHTKKKYEIHYSDNEYYFNFNSFYVYNKDRIKGKLTTIDYNLDKFYIKNTKKREGYCHILHKNTPKTYKNDLDKFDSIDLGNWFDKGGYDYLREEFQKYEYFLTFDQKTYLTVAAALCGCKSIILNPNYRDENIGDAYTDSEDYLKPKTPLEYRQENPTNMFGVAYGIEDLEWADKTIHMVRDHILEMEKIDSKSIDNFIDFWNKKCYG